MYLNQVILKSIQGKGFKDILKWNFHITYLKLEKLENYEKCEVLQPSMSYISIFGSVLFLTFVTKCEDWIISFLPWERLASTWFLSFLDEYANISSVLQGWLLKENDFPIKQKEAEPSMQ